MTEFFKYLFKIILKALLPAFLIYFAKDDFISDTLIQNNLLITIDNVSVYKFWAFLIGTVIVVFIVPIELYFAKRKLKKQKAIFKTVVPILTAQIAEDLNLNSNQLCIRVFRVKKKWFSKEVLLLHKDLEGITHRINGDTILEFKVTKDSIQGVVGKTYVEESYVVDYNITNLNSYELTTEQVSRIGDVKFCCAAPIFKSNKIKYLISLDSNERVFKSKAKTDCLKKNLVYLCQLFDEFIL